MNIEFFGVRGSIPRPLSPDEILSRLGAKSKDGVVKMSTIKAMAKNGGLGYGSNTSCVYVEKDGDHIIIDAGTGLRELGARLVQTPVEQPIHLVLTHLHWDHIQGLPFFAPIYQKGRVIKVYSAIPKDSLEVAFLDQWRAPYFPVPYEALLSKIEYHHFTRQTKIGPFKVKALEMCHPNPTFGYRVECDGKSYAHMSDTELNLITPAEGKRYKKFLAGVDLLVTDSQFDVHGAEVFQGWGHSSMISFIDLLKDEGVKVMALFHHNPQTEESYIDRLFKEAKAHAKKVIPDGSTKIICAIEGQVVRL